MRFVIFALVVIPLVFLATSVHARTYDIEAVGEYVMGDSDTKLEARRIALEQAKRSAVEQIGTYLESETIIVNNALTKDEIRTYTAAVLKSTVLSEALALLEDKSTVFRIKIKANVDAGVLDEKIKEIKEDSKRKAQLTLLQVENTMLLKELEALSSRLKATNTEGTKRLREERENLFARLDKNENTIQFIFEKGTLLRLALKNQDTLAQEKKDVDDFFQLLADNVKFKLGKPKIRLIDDKAELIVDVSYKLENINNIIEILNNKFGLDSFSDKKAREMMWNYAPCRFGIDANLKFASDAIVFEKHDMKYKGFGFTGVNGDAIFSYFIHKKIDIVLQVGSIKDVVEIANLCSCLYGYDDYMKYLIEIGNDEYKKLPYTEKYFKIFMYHIETGNDGYSGKKYFKISNIPKNKLNDISSINAKVVISNRE